MSLDENIDEEEKKDDDNNKEDKQNKPKNQEQRTKEKDGKHEGCLLSLSTRFRKRNKRLE